MVIHRDTERHRRKHHTAKTASVPDLWGFLLTINMIWSSWLFCCVTQQDKLLYFWNVIKSRNVHAWIHVCKTYVVFLLSPSFNFPRAIWQVHNIPYFVFLKSTCMCAYFFCEMPKNVMRKTSYHCLPCRLMLPLHGALLHAQSIHFVEDLSASPQKTLFQFRFQRRKHCNGHISHAAHYCKVHKNMKKWKLYDDYYL